MGKTTDRMTVDGVQYEIIDAAIRLKVGDTDLPTTAQTLTGAVAEHESDITNQQGQINLHEEFFGNTYTEDFIENYIDYGTIIPGYFINDIGSQSAESESACTDFIEVREESAIFYNVWLKNARSIATYDTNKQFIRAFNNLGNDEINKLISFTSSEKYVRLTLLKSSTAKRYGLYTKYENIDKIESKIRNINDSLGLLGFTDLPLYKSGCYISTTGEEVNESISGVTDYIPVNANESLILFNVFTQGSRSICAYDSNKEFIANIRERAVSGLSTQHILIPYNAAYIRATLSIETTKKAYAIHDVNCGIILSASDEVTITDAINAGYTNIGLLGGNYYQQIDLTNLKGSQLRLYAYQPHSQPKIYNPNCVIATSATNVTGYTKVKSAPFSGSFDSNLRWIYQNDVPDTRTTISDTDRHPLQRGKVCRCDDTRINRCSAFSVESALTEIEEYDGYKWYLDSSNNVLYFSSPEAVTADNPICYSDGSYLFTGIKRTYTVEAIGIEVKYMTFNVTGMVGSRLIDCAARNAFNWGAFDSTNALSSTFIRCEASECHNNTNGDGFNGDTNNSGEAFSKTHVSTYIDCWSHDNADDGWSYHRRSETTIIGGLYEYNGKAGITPSYGNHCTCYNVYSRNNYCGFFYTGEVQSEEGGKYGQLTCFYCVAERNNTGGQHAGFAVSDSGNSLILVGCKSIGNTYGYKTNDASNTITLIDCGSMENSEVKYGPGTFTIKNTNIVT